MFYVTLYTNCSKHINEAFVSTLSISDHYPICISRSTKISAQNTGKHTTISYRCFKSFDEGSFQRDLSFSGMQSVENINDPNEALHVFYKILNNIITIHAPLKEKRIKHDQQPEWFDDDIKEMMFERDNCHKKGKFDQYKILRNKVSYMIKKKKKNFFNNAVKQNKDQGFLWKNLKNISELNKSNTVILPEKLISDNTEIRGNVNIANELNKHFVNISNMIQKTAFSKTNFDDLKKKLDKKLTHHEFKINLITPYEVKLIIDKLDITKSTGLDGIGPKIIKHCGDYITPAIASIINNSILSGVYPDALKEARVIPIYKSGNRDDANNYRPISILPTMSKIFERHIASQMLSYFDKTDIIHRKQSGFRKNHSCSTALTHLIDLWLHDIDIGKYIGTVFLDLKKAFDLVDHQILIYKLKLYHFSEISIKLFKSYLSNRKQLLKVGEVTSEMLYTVSGVPQGSILGPLLFLLYINDIVYSSIDIHIDLYADDSTMYESGYDLKSIQTKLQNNLNDIEIWCKLNNMAVNPSKSKCMVMGTKQKVKRKTIHLLLNGSVLENVTVQKLLGVLIDNTLSWRSHIDNVCKKVGRQVALLKRITYFLTFDMKIMFYNAYILPIFDYCCPIWGKDNKTYINKLSKLQKRIAKIILKYPQLPQSADPLKELDWLSFDDRCKYHTAVQVYKIFNCMAPAYMNELLKTKHNKIYNLRSNSRNEIAFSIRPRTNYFKDTFSYYSMNIWNSIPLEIRKSMRLNTFKVKYKAYLLKYPQKEMIK